MGKGERPVSCQNLPALAGQTQETIPRWASGHVRSHNPTLGWEMRKVCSLGAPRPHRGQGQRVLALWHHKMPLDAAEKLRTGPRGSSVSHRDKRERRQGEGTHAGIVPAGASSWSGLVTGNTGRQSIGFSVLL